MSISKPAGAKLNQSLHCTLIGSSAALWITGAVWLILHNFAQVEGEFGIVPHLLEPVMLQLHGFVLIPALLSFGGILFGHIGNGWNYRKNKISGVIMLAALILLIGTGYVLYYTGSDIMRQASSLAHWITGLAAPLVFLKHSVKRVNRSLSTSRGTIRPRTVPTVPSLEGEGCVPASRSYVISASQVPRSMLELIRKARRARLQSRFSAKRL